LLYASIAALFGSCIVHQVNLAKKEGVKAVLIFVICLMAGCRTPNMESPGAQLKGNDMKQNRSELIQKAINYAQKETRLKFTGERHVRDAMIV
jgi:hypothetical protein